jgi:exodeoxyribonuclease VII large subunit
MRRRGRTAVPSSSPSLFDEERESPRAELTASPPSVHEIYDEVGETFPGASPHSAISVSTLTQTAKDVVEGAFIPLWVRGEVSDFKSHRNGHWYFSLRDRSSQLRCVVWSRDQVGIPAAPDDGMQVAVMGQLGVYASRGEMQFTVRRLVADGDGLWRKALEQSRVRLEADGLLAATRKRALPRFPRRIAFVTSASGAALHDVVAVLRRRAPGVELVVAHASVQGGTAPLELCAALERVCRWGGADLVIIGRGGGSRDDLWAFNDECVARAVAACPVPTISAVGHEIDVTLCDLVADFRAPTPSAAAEAASPSRDEIALMLGAQRQRLIAAIETCLLEPRERAADAARMLGAAVEAHVAERRSALGALAGRLHALSPLATLERGYAAALDTDGATLTSAAQFTEGGEFTLRLRDGEVDATARRVRVSGEGA